MFRLDSTTIPMITSGVAVCISLATFIESIRGKKRQEKRAAEQYRLDNCNEALRILNQNNLNVDFGTEKFNQLCACKEVLGRNLLSLTGKKLNDMLERMKKIESDYGKVSGRNLNQYSTNLDITCKLYDEELFPVHLEELYNELRSEAFKLQEKLLGK